MEKDFSGSTKFLDEIVLDAENEAAEIIKNAEIFAQEKNVRLKNDLIESTKRFEEKFKEDKLRIDKNINSKIQMEEKKVESILREAIIKDSIKTAMEKIEEFSEQESYKEIIGNLIIEAAKGLEKEELKIFCSLKEKNFLTENFLREIEKKLKEETGIKFSFKLENKISEKLGVLVSDKDNRLIYDNRFETRLLRFQSFIRRAVYKEVFGE